MSVASAMRRAARRAAARSTPKPVAQQDIQLCNPVSAQFGSFIVGNAPYATGVVIEGSAAGQHLVLCGAGPTLADHAAEWCPQGDQVWGCNSALTWLAGHGHAPTHGFTVDQTPHMVVEWKTAPEVHYLIASTAHPHLLDLLRARGRAYTFFHNYVGIPKMVEIRVCQGCRCMIDADGTLTDTSALGVLQIPVEGCTHEVVTAHTVTYEDWLYTLLYDPTVRSGSGLNTVTRAIDVGLFMGFDRITVLGADCALRVRSPKPDAEFGSLEHQRWLHEDVTMHVDGGHALASGATAVTIGGPIDGRHWETKPDMAITAYWLVQMKRKLGDRLHLVGDTLPNAIMDKDDGFLARLPAMTDSDGNPVAIDYVPWGADA
jgi:hypothetical protein